MGFGDKFKNIFNVSEEEYFDDMDMEDNGHAEEEASRDVRSSGFSFNRSRNESSDGKVVDMRSSVPTSGSKAQIVFKKLDRYEDVGSVATVLNEKKIVVLNLETCPNDVSVRIIDFLSGVAFANDGEMKRIAGRAYIIAPYNVPLTGELLDGYDYSAY